ncbi:acyl-CoA thioesterase [Blastococcus sp. VKM Ac-2987]|uniref:acyl-CoA thioesterase n=1 Tax=Blastococcus sp. VKM Ac-2987 TaxID=3004141 RepID=UPI0022ABC491|nr:thioesterase family protein [Blastococcus sp. VKM Ac-2987]MCZ2857542.1 thioesterase family protein [Blastococcus sp. VKM Ac-2987]
MRHTAHVPMRWSDMDAYQHINNVAFLGYFEMARVQLFFEQPTHDDHTGMRRGLVVASHEIAYKRSVVYDADPLEVQVWVSGVRAAAFTCHYELFDHGKLAVTGSTLLVPFDFALARPRRLTVEEKEFLARWADDRI